MAYIVKYEDDYLFDPYTNDDAISDVKLSAEVNAAAYFDFSIPCTHHLYDKIAERDGIVRVYSDKKLLFIGEIIEISDDFNQNKTVSCVDPRDHLDDVMIRPYSTVEGEEPLLAPSSIDGYFQWLVDQYNNGMINAKFHFQVGVNQGGSLTKSNYIYKKNEGLPGVGSEIENEILDTYGGYLILTYPEGTPTLNLYSDVHEANTQIIDFGVNLIDFTRTTSTTDQYTAIRPVGGTPEKTDDDPNDYRPKPVTIEGLTDGTTSVDSDYVKNGDVVCCISKVNRYGYREYNWTESDTLDANTLLEEAIADLKKQVEPKITIDVKAVDLALFMEDYDHLECGEVARIRSKPHGVDEYLLVSSMDINLQDPSQTSYTFGRAYDSLTGEQSAYVKSLNSGINSSLDVVAGLDQTIKDQATKVDQAVTDAGNALNTANTAKDTADNASKTASTASTNASTALNTANTAKSTADTANTNATEAKSSASTAVSTANTAKSTADSAKSTASTASTNATNALNRATYQYGTCATAAATAAKVVTLSGFSLFTGATIQVKFTYANTVANPTLNVNSTGAKTIHAYGASIPASSPYDWVSGAIVTFVYDGTYWNIADASSLSKANSAQSTANAANSTANTAKQNAATAQSTANTANSTANAAKTAAESASSAASAAQSTASQAQTAVSDLGETVASNYSELAQTAESIQASVASVTETTGVLTTKMTEVEQTAESVRISVTNVTDRVNNVEEITDGIDTYFDFGSDGLTIGETGSEMKTVISSSEQRWEANGQTVMELDGTSSSVIAKQVKIGNYQWQPTSDGTGINLVYIG